MTVRRALPAGVGGLHRPATIQRHLGPRGLHLASRRPQLRELHRRLHRGELRHALPEHADRHRPAVIAVLFIASMVAFAVTRFSWQVQPAVPDALHRRQPAAAPGPHRAALPDLPAADHPRPAERQRPPLRPVLRAHLHQRRVPDGLLRLRPEQLHEDALQGADEAALADGAPVWRSSGTSRCRSVALRLRRSPRWSSPSSTTTSSGRCS